jgi:hypothetical protein
MSWLLSTTLSLDKGAAKMTDDYIESIVNQAMRNALKQMSIVVIGIIVGYEYGSTGKTFQDLMLDLPKLIREATDKLN